MISKIIKIEVVEVSTKKHRTYKGGSYNIYFEHTGLDCPLYVHGVEYQLILCQNELLQKGISGEIIQKLVELAKAVEREEAQDND
jgi:hypothetical protein